MIILQIPVDQEIAYLANRLRNHVSEPSLGLALNLYSLLFDGGRQPNLKAMMEKLDNHSELNPRLRWDIASTLLATADAFLYEIRALDRRGKLKVRFLRSRCIVEADVEEIMDRRISFVRWLDGLKDSGYEVTTEQYRLGKLYDQQQEHLSKIAKN